MSEIKGINVVESNIPKFELKQYWEDYREDFNTATLPHKKYYNYDKWERAQHHKESQQTNASMSSVQRAEHEYQLQRQQAQIQQQRQLLQSTMSRDKVQEMKEMAQLRTEMQVAFQRGDMTTYQRLKDKLEGK